MNKKPFSKVVVFGGDGLVGSRFIALNSKLFTCKSPTIEQLDLLQKNAAVRFIESETPDVLVNFAAFTNVDEAENQSGDRGGLVYQLNVGVAGELAKICKENGIFLIHISTDYVFDGRKKEPYIESDKPSPLNWYGKTKHLGEVAIQESGCKFAIVRIQFPYRAHYVIKKDLARTFFNLLQTGKEIYAISDAYFNPLFIDDLSYGLRRIIEEKSEGIFHISSTDFITPFQFVTMIARQFSLNQDLIHETSFNVYMKGRKTARPKNSWFDVSKFIKIFGQGILHSNSVNIATFKRQVTK